MIGEAIHPKALADLLAFAADVGCSVTKDNKLKVFVFCKRMKAPLQSGSAAVSRRTSRASANDGSLRSSGAPRACARRRRARLRASACRAPALPWRLPP